MSLIRRFAIVVSGLAFVALCSACSSSDSSTGGVADDAGTSQPKGNPCRLSACPNEPMYLSDDYCAQALAGSCAADLKAYVACSRANDRCNAEGKQDVSAFEACLEDGNRTARCLSGGDAGAE